jgi:hypothetical protein
MHTPAAVFLNGDYYGPAWLKTPRTENHLARIYGGDSNNFQFVEGGDNRLVRSWWNGERHARNDLHEISDLAMKGFTGAGGDARFEEFSSRIDVDGLIRYYAMQIYLNNYDWPNHNIEMWRYFPTENERNDPNLHPYLRDGRWRVFAHDIEAAWSIWDNDDRTVRDDTLRDILTGSNNNRWNSSHSSAFLYALVERDDTRAQLANTFVDLIEGAFSTENIIRTLDGLISMIQNEINHALRMNIIDPDNEWWPTIESFENSHTAIRRFARDRPEHILRSVHANLGFDRNNRFTVALTTTEGGGAVMNSRPVTDAQTVIGNYYAGTEIRITAQPFPGYTVDYWTVNDVRRNGDVITVNENADVRLYFIRN